MAYKGIGGEDFESELDALEKDAPKLHLSDKLKEKIADVEKSWDVDPALMPEVVNVEGLPALKARADLLEKVKKEAARAVEVANNELKTRIFSPPNLDFDTATCNKCGWSGLPEELKGGRYCPECGEDLKPKTGNEENKDPQIQCPQCGWIGKLSELVDKFKCPKCGAELFDDPNKAREPGVPIVGDLISPKGSPDDVYRVISVTMSKDGKPIIDAEKVKDKRSAKIKRARELKDASLIDQRVAQKEKFGGGDELIAKNVGILMGG